MTPPRALTQALDLGDAVHEQAPHAAQLLVVLPSVEVVDELGVDSGVVRRPVPPQQVLFDVGRGGVVVLDGGGVEDTVRIRGVVGGHIAEAADGGVYLRRRVGVIQVGGNLCGALPSAHDEEPAVRRGGEPVDAAEQTVVVEHPGAGLDPVREHGAQPGRDNDRPRPDPLASAAARHHDGEGRTVMVSGVALAP